MCTDLVVVLKIEKEIQEIMQSVGICQGNNMAPVLFLFLMSAAAKTLEVKWREAGIAVLKVAHSSNDELESRCIHRHTPCMYNSTRLTAFEIFQLLYVDNGAFPFPDCNALIAGINLIYSHFACFGLEIHIGWGEESSKTKCVFFPPPQFFNDNDVCSTPGLTNGHADNPWLSYPVPPSALCTHVPESESAHIAREEAKYDALPETAKIDVSNGYVTFLRMFKYLGSKILYSLRDDDNIDARLIVALQSMGALKEVWRNQHLDTYSKYLLFRAIPMNLLLWGCKNWSLQQDLLCCLEVFLHCSIRRILHIFITNVQEQHLQNEKGCCMFYDIPCVKNMIAARQLGFLRKVVRGPIDRPARRMLTACCQHKRNQGRPYLHNKDVIIRNLRLLFKKVPKVVINDYGSVKDWFQEASHEKYLTQLDQCLLDNQAPLPTPPTECPPPPLETKPPWTEGLG